MRSNCSLLSLSDSPPCSLPGLTVAVAKAETPVVNGYFCLPTEAHDNDGLPHILEHLIFLGSDEYPYKEALDYLGRPSPIPTLRMKTNISYLPVSLLCLYLFLLLTAPASQKMPG